MLPITLGIIIGLTIPWLDYKFGTVTVSEGITWLKQKISGEK